MTINAAPSVHESASLVRQSTRLRCTVSAKGREASDVDASLP